MEKISSTLRPLLGSLCDDTMRQSRMRRNNSPQIWIYAAKKDSPPSLASRAKRNPYTFARQWLRNLFEERVVGSQEFPAYPGVSTQVLVVALDASNHVVKNFTGTIAFTSSDASAILPAAHAFTATDHAVHVFSTTFETTGTWTITVKDTDFSTITGSVPIDLISTPSRHGNPSWEYWF